MIGSQRAYSQSIGRNYTVQIECRRKFNWAARKARRAQAWRSKHGLATNDMPYLQFNQSGEQTGRDMFARIYVDVPQAHVLLQIDTDHPDVSSKISDETSTEEIGTILGNVMAKKALECGINGCKYDKNGFLFEDACRAMEYSAREAGLTVYHWGPRRPMPVVNNFTPAVPEARLAGAPFDMPTAQSAQ